MQGPRVSHSGGLPDEQRQVESDCVEQEPLENVLIALQVRSSHAAGFIHVRKASFGKLRPELLEVLAPPPTHPPPVPIHFLLLFFLAVPIPPPALRLRHVAPHTFLFQIPPDRPT